MDLKSRIERSKQVQELADPLAREAIELMKNQLILILIEKLGGQVVIPVSDIDELPKGKLLKMEAPATGLHIGSFIFTVERKQ